MKTIILPLAFIAGTTLAAIHQKGIKDYDYRPTKKPIPEKLSVDGLIQKYSKDIKPYYHEPVRLLRAIIEKESSGKNLARKSEAQFIQKYKDKDMGSSHGLMQIMGFNARALRVTIPELYDSETNIQVGTHILVGCLQKETRQGVTNLTRALACYNQGPEKQYNKQALKYAAAVIKKIGV